LFAKRRHFANRDIVQLPAGVKRGDSLLGNRLHAQDIFIGISHDISPSPEKLATLEAQREGQRVNDVGRIGSLRAANRPRKLNRGVDGALTLGNDLDRRRQPESDACGCVLPGGGANGRLPPFASLSDTVKGRP